MVFESFLKRHSISRPWLRSQKQQLTVMQFESQNQNQKQVIRSVLRRLFYLITHRVTKSHTEWLFVHDNSNNFSFKFFSHFLIRPNKIFTEKVHGVRNAHGNLYLCFILVWSESFMRHPIKSYLNFFSTFHSMCLKLHIVVDDNGI